MIAFEVRDGIIKPVVVCDFCHARIVAMRNNGLRPACKMNGKVQHCRRRCGERE